MWLPKINSKFLLTLFLIFSNFWIYLIFGRNVLVGIAVIISSLTILLTNQKKILLLVIIFLAILQFQTTSVKSLTLLDNDEQRVQSERSKSYPPVYLQVMGKVLWLKPESWIEKNPTIIALSRLEENLLVYLDINKYFFGGFPRNKAGDFEKFPFAYLPFFLTGLYVLIKRNLRLELGILLGLPLALLAYLGSDNRFGPFVLFPFFLLSIWQGINFLEGKFKNKNRFYLILLLSVFFTLILQISYGKS